MSLLSHSTLSHLIESYGYVAVFVLVMLESSGIPMPGETALISASIYAGTTHRIDIVLVILAAAAGAIIGDNIGYLAGRELGFRLLLRFGRKIRLDEARLKLGQYLFLRYGGAIVFFGRFVAVLRAYAALLAGANRMEWPRFLLFNALGGIAWTVLYGGGAYVLGKSIHRVALPVGIAALAVVVLGFIAGWVFLRRHEKELVVKAERALPGPLERHLRRRS